MAVRANAHGGVQQSRRRSLANNRTSDWGDQQEASHSKPRIEGDYLILPIKIDKGIPGTKERTITYMDYRVPRGER